MRQPQRNLAAVQKPFVGIQIGIAEKLEQAAVKSLGTSLEDGIDVASSVASLGGIVKAGLNLEFLHYVRTRQRRVGQLGHVVVRGADAFDQVIVVVLALPVDLDAHVATPQRSGSVQVRIGSSRKRQQLLEVLRGQRQVADGARVDGLTRGRSRGVNRLHLCLHFNLLLHCEGPQLGLHTRGLSHAHRNVDEFTFLKTGTGHVHRVVANGQQSRSERATGVSRSGTGQSSSVLIDDANFRTRYHRPAGIQHGSADGAGRAALRPGLRDPDKSKQTDPKQLSQEQPLKRSRHTPLPNVCINV